MNKISKLKIGIGAGLLALGLVTFSPFSLAAPEGVDYNKIIDNCERIKADLRFVETNSDIVVRVNYGQAYASALENIIAPTNARLVANRINNPKVIDLTQQIEAELEEFKASYQAYDTQMRQTLEINCEKQPQVFYQQLQSARALRAKTHQNVLGLNQLVLDYQTQVNQSIDTAVKNEAKQ